METTESNALGSIHISSRSIAILAARTAVSVPGVVSLGATLTETAARKIGRASLTQGVDASIDGKEITLTVRFIARYGCRIPDVAMNVQKQVKDAVENATGCQVAGVHIIVQDIAFPDETMEGRRDDESMS